MRVGTEPHSSEPGTEEISQDSSFFKAALVALSNPEIPSAFLLPMYLFFSFHVCKETPEIQQVKKKKKKRTAKRNAPRLFAVSCLRVLQPVQWFLESSVRGAQRPFLHHASSSGQGAGYQVSCCAVEAELLCPARQQIGDR